MMATDAGGPLISVVIPVYNGRETLRHCLAGLAETDYRRWECIVVDDGSTDGSAQVAQEFGARVVQSPRRGGGPASARNQGAEVARGQILLFVDSDVVVYPDTVGRVAANFRQDPSLVACIGSYDDAPADPGFFSRYKNLQHHYVHQTSQEEASTFWTGCGAIEREIFLEMGGFNTGYARPSIEDIELGVRLRAHGHRIRLDKQLQVKHLKRWTARSLILTDVRDRAIPWTRLLLRQEKLLDDLNLQKTQRWSTVASLGGLVGMGATLIFPPAIVLVLSCFGLVLLLNRPFYRFLRQKQGMPFTVAALFWHWLYFVYSGLIFGTLFSLDRLRTWLATVPVRSGDGTT